jgi:hypothetical protein
MKKKLEAELISIAHRILKLKNKSDINQLYSETQKLYEKLAVLKFVEEHLGDVKPTIGQSEIEDKITAAFETVNEDPSDSELAKQTEAAFAVEEPQGEIPAAVESEATSEDSEEEVQQEEPVKEEEQEPEPVEEEPEAVAEVTAATEEDAAEFDTPAALAGELTQEEEPETAEATAEAEKPEDSLFKPAFELAFDAKEDEKEEVKEDAKEQFKDVNSQITFEDILGSSYVDPVFVTPEDLAKENETKQPDNVIPIGRNFSDSPVISINKTDSERSYTLNDRMSKGITIGLNDRVAFMKHLFNNSSEDYNRVLSQLITFDTFDEAKSFIDNIVKPDYSNWDGKEEYADRFMEIVEKKFS